MKTARDAIADLLEQALTESWANNDGEKWSHIIKRRLLSAPEPVRLELAIALTNGISLEFPIESLIPGLLKQPENIRLKLVALLNPSGTAHYFTPAEIELMMEDAEHHRAGTVQRTPDGYLRTYYGGFNLTTLAEHICREMAQSDDGLTGIKKQWVGGDEVIITRAKYDALMAAAKAIHSKECDCIDQCMKACAVHAAKAFLRAAGIQTETNP
jgi:hypothetical protein